MKTVNLKIEGMTCEHCQNRVKKALLSQKGVKEALVSYKDNNAVITYKETKINLEQLKHIIEECGYRVQGD